MAKKSKFPKQVYIAFQEERDGSVFLSVYDDPSGHAEVNQDVQVAVYELVRVGKVTAKATLE
jgi:hypothetical protein